MLQREDLDRDLARRGEREERGALGGGPRAVDGAERAVAALCRERGADRGLVTRDIFVDAEPSEALE